MEKYIIKIINKNKNRIRIRILKKNKKISLHWTNFKNLHQIQINNSKKADQNK